MLNFQSIRTSHARFGDHVDLSIDKCYKDIERVNIKFDILMNDFFVNLTLNLPMVYTLGIKILWCKEITGNTNKQNFSV